MDIKDEKTLPHERGNISLDVTQQEAPFSIVNALKVVQSPTNPSWVKTREQGKTTLSYISGDLVIRLLNKAFNYRWSYEVLETRVVDSIDRDTKYDKEPVPQTPVVQSLGRLTVPGWGVREQWGSQVILAANADQQGNAFKGAATDALKKCASTFGIGLDLYGQEGMRELAVTPNDILTDDEQVLGKFKDKIEKELKDQQKNIQNYKSEESVHEEEQNAGPSTDAPQSNAAPKQQSTPSTPANAQTDNAAVGSGNTQANTQTTPPPAEKTESNSEQASGRWQKEDIEAMRALKERLGIAPNDNESLNPHVQKFFKDDSATLHMIRPNNVKDFLHFMGQQ